MGAGAPVPGGRSGQDMWETWAPRVRRPLLKGLGRPMTDAERAAMVEQAMRAIADQPGLPPHLKERGMAALAAARRRFESRLS